MEQGFWNLFRETGDPMGYLLWKAEERSREQPAGQRKPAGEETVRTPPAGPPPASN